VEPETPPDETGTPEVRLGLEAVSGTTAPPDKVEEPVSWPAVIGTVSPLLFVADPTTMGDVTPVASVAETGKVAVPETKPPFESVTGPVSAVPELTGSFDWTAPVSVAPVLTGAVD